MYTYIYEYNLAPTTITHPKGLRQGRGFEGGWKVGGKSSRRVKNKSNWRPTPSFFAMFLSRILVKSSCLVEMLGGGQPYKRELAKRGGSSGWSWAIEVGK